MTVAMRIKTNGRKKNPMRFFVTVDLIPHSANKAKAINAMCSAKYVIVKM